ncbi:unnamed protein product [Blepharisma stoltei]|uniref:Uncharacterized protein n=1 Tax=Blepharisma stoltei TaxID=1481888 RepID=A0AAU9JLZ2_9CILI|nr:unnamed protein product [Blepharisma stoltei]
MVLTKGNNTIWMIGGITALFLGYQMYNPNSYWNSKTAVRVIKKGVAAEVKDQMPRASEKAQELKKEVKEDIKSHIPPK